MQDPGEIVQQAGFTIVFIEISMWSPCGDRLWFIIYQTQRTILENTKCVGRIPRPFCHLNTQKFSIDKRNRREKKKKTWNDEDVKCTCQLDVFLNGASALFTNLCLLIIELVIEVVTSDSWWRCSPCKKKITNLNVVWKKKSGFRRSVATA